MNLSPKQIVQQLDKYIIGQDEAKKAVAIALRNRYRRAMLPQEVMFSLISVLGVPGYAADTFTPASNAPLAMASLPSMIFTSLISMFLSISTILSTSEQIRKSYGFPHWMRFIQ